jgi:hypothetical protein
MLPYLIAGAIGFGIGKLFEEGGETFGRGGMTNEDILRSFLTSNRETQTNNLSTHYNQYDDFLLLRNYSTLIAIRKGNDVRVTNIKYSNTTSKITNRLKALAEEMGYNVSYVSEFEGGGSVDESSFKKYANKYDFYTNEEDNVIRITSNDKELLDKIEKDYSDRIAHREYDEYIEVFKNKFKTINSNSVEYIITLVPTGDWTDTYNLIIDRYSDEFGGSSHSVMKILSKIEAERMFEKVNESNAEDMYRIFAKMPTHKNKKFAGGGKTTQKYVVTGNVYDGGEVWKQTFDNLDEAIDLAREIQNGWTDDGTYYLITIYNEKGKKVAEISDDKYFNELTENKLFKKFDLDAGTKKERQIENEKLKGYKFKLEVFIANGSSTPIFNKTFDSIFDVMDKMNTYYEEDYYALINDETLDYWEDKIYEIDEERNYIKGKYGWYFIKEGNLWIAQHYGENYIVRIKNGKLESNDSAVTKGALKQIAELESQKKYSEKPKHNKSLADMKKIWDKLSKNYKEREDIAFLVGYYGGLLEQIVPYKWNDIEKGTQIRIMNAYFGQTEEEKQKIINEYRKRHEALVKEHKTLRNLYGLDKKGKELFGVKKFAGGGGVRKYAKGGIFGESAKLEYVDDAFASDELKSELQEKLGISSNDLGDNVVISFAYTDYGGDFLDKVAIRYFQENYPENTLVENTSYFGKNAYVFGEPAKEWIETTEDYPLGFEDFESYYYEKEYEQQLEDFDYFLDEISGDYSFDKNAVLNWLLENRSGYYNITTQGLDFSSSDLTDELVNKGLIEKIDEEDEYAGGGGVKKRRRRANTQIGKTDMSVDKTRVAKPVGYRFTNSLASKLRKDQYAVPTEKQITKYLGKGIYKEYRKNKSDRDRIAKL